MPLAETTRSDDIWPHGSVRHSLQTPTADTKLQVRFCLAPACSFRDQDVYKKTSTHGRSKAADSIAQVSISRTLIDTLARRPYSLNSDGDGSALHFDIKAGYEAG